MINKETSKVTYTTVADASAPYAVPFEFYAGGPGSTGPELLVTLDGTTLAYGTDYTLTDAGLVLVKSHTAGESLVIERDIPLTQEQDFQVGYIDPEQVEEGFDRSVMRDQMLSDRIAKNEEDVAGLAQDISGVRDIAQNALTAASSAEHIANSAAQDAVDAKNAAAAAEQKAQDALDSVGQFDARITKNTQDIAANTAAIRVNEADIAANEADIAETRAIANQAKSDSGAAQDAANQATTTASDAQATANSALSKANANETAIAGVQATADSALSKANANTTEIAGVRATADSALSKANANETEIATIKQDQADLGDQVHEIEAKIPGDASATNQLATKGDLADIDALPDQTGNAGKFLTTNGTAASWADVKQGGGIEWFKQLSSTVTELEYSYNNLFFTIPKDQLVVGHTYEFYSSCIGMPIVYDSNGISRQFSNKTMYTKFFLDNDGSIRGLAYFAHQNEQAYDSNENPFTEEAIWDVGETSDSQSIIFLGQGPNGSSIEFIHGTVGQTYQNMSITKIHDVTSGVDIEPQQVGQSLVDSVPGYTSRYSIHRYPLMTIDIPSDNYVSTYLRSEPLFGFYLPNFYDATMGWFNNRGVLTLCVREITKVSGEYNSTISDYTFNIIVSGQRDNVIVKEVHKSGGYADKTISCSRANGNPSTLSIYFDDKSSMHTGGEEADTMVLIALMWYGIPVGISYYTGVYSSVGDIPAADIVYDTIPDGASGDYVEKDQGAENAGKFLKVGTDGQVIASAESAGGGLTAVSHDATLAGSGTDDDPLKVADPIPSGGTVGQVLTKTEGGSEWKNVDIPDVSTFATKEELSGYLPITGGSVAELTIGGSTATSASLQFSTRSSGFGISSSGGMFELTGPINFAGYASMSSIGTLSGFLTVPNKKSGTIATTDDIPDVSAKADKSMFQVVDALPENPDANTFYFVKKAA